MYVQQRQQTFEIDLFCLIKTYAKSTSIYE